MKKSQRIVITGGSGFIGSFLIRELNKRGLDNILVIDRNIPNIITNDFECCDVFKNSYRLKCMLNQDDIVVHLACTTIPGTSQNDVIRDARENIEGSLRFLDICRKRKIKKIIFPSSGGAVYGSQGGKKYKYSEQCPTKPTNSYGVIKIAIEHYLAVYKHLHGLEHSILRISNPYGRLKMTDSQFGAVDVFIRKALRDEEISVWGDGEIIRDYIHIDDVINFFILAITNDSIKGIYNVGTGQGLSLNHVVRVIGTVLKKKLNVVHKESRAVDVKYNVLDIKKALQTGWKPKYDLTEGINDVYNRVLPMKLPD